MNRELGKVRLGQGRLDEARSLLEGARAALAELRLQAEVLDATSALTHVLVVEGDRRRARAMTTAPRRRGGCGRDELLGRIHWLLGASLMLSAEWDAADAAFAAGRDAAARWDGGHVRALNLVGLVAVAPHTQHDRRLEAMEARTSLHRLGVIGLPAPFESVQLEQ